jgi:hypothetical protein
VALVCIAVEFAAQWNVHSFLVWRYDADTKRIFEVLEKIPRPAGQPDGSVRLGVSWVLEPALNFYRETRKASWMAPVVRDGFDGARQFYIATPQDQSTAPWPTLKQIYKGPVSGTALAVPATLSRIPKEFNMALLERVATLVRANLNDIIDKAEEPEKMIKQVILDMQNQLLQVKTQVAIAIADQHLLEKKQKENQEKAAEWVRKAELAVDKKEDDLARAALERSISYRSLAGNFGEQHADQTVQVENLKLALRKLEQKLAEAQAKSDC